MQNIRVETAQNVFIEYQPASVGDRILATLVDSVILYSYVFGCIALLNYLSIDMGWGVASIIYIPYLGYHLISEIFMDGQSIGKKVRNIKVVKLDGSQPKISDYLLRWLIRPIDIIFFGAIAIVTISSNGKGQRLGDIAAGTSVVNMERRVGLAETAMPSVQDAYEPVYPQAIALSDHDVAIIKEALHVHVNSEEPNSRLLDELARKVKSILQVESTLPNLAFLRTILKDHAYLTGNA